MLPQFAASSVHWGGWRRARKRRGLWTGWTGKVSCGGACDRASDRPQNPFSLHRSGSPRSDWTPGLTSVYLVWTQRSMSGWVH